MKVALSLIFTISSSQRDNRSAFVSLKKSRFDLDWICFQSESCLFVYLQLFLKHQIISLNAETKNSSRDVDMYQLFSRTNKHINIFFTTSMTRSPLTFHQRELIWFEQLIEDFSTLSFVTHFHAKLELMVGPKKKNTLLDRKSNKEERRNWIELNCCVLVVMVDVTSHSWFTTFSQLQKSFWVWWNWIGTRQDFQLRHIISI